MKTKGKVSDYVKANRKGSREAEFEVSAGWTAKTKIHKSKKLYDRKGRNWKSDSGLFRCRRASNLIFSRPLKKSKINCLSLSIQIYF